MDIKLKMLNESICNACYWQRPNGSCNSDVWNSELKRCMAFEYHDVEMYTTRCRCGYWSCGTRGCGDCPDCCGGQCECDL